MALLMLACIMAVILSELFDVYPSLQRLQCEFFSCSRFIHAAIHATDASFSYVPISAPCI